MLSIAALLLLIRAFLTDDFSIAMVGQYSSLALPVYYKLSAVWAGSAGSLFFWSAMVLVLFAFWLAKSKAGDIRFNAIALSVGSAVCLGFSALLVFIEKPFEISMLTIGDGVGLNPLLQNFWMVIHPPLLFIGYAAFLIPFMVISAIALSGLAAEPSIYSRLRRWLMFAICFLSLGIVTGARWSYIELGWGGYWSWDPVENASILPWFVAVAALHSLIGTRVADKFRFWTVVLAPVPFILCLVATFITRSGLLQSVHSFGHSIVGVALLVFIALCLLLWLACIIRFKNGFFAGPSGRSEFHLNEQEILSWGSLILVLTAVVIGIATFWPVIWRAVAGSSIAPARLFYDRLISVSGILLAFLIGLGSLAALPKRGMKLLGCCVAGLICSGFAFNPGGRHLIMSLACGMAAFSCVAVLMKLWFNLKSSGKIGGGIAHLGLLILVVAVGFSSFESVVQTHLDKGWKIAFGGYTIIYHSFENKSAGGVTMAGPEIYVKKDVFAEKLWPHNSLYPDGSSASEVAVYTGIWKDIYISFDGVGQSEQVIITVKEKPMMFWLWVGAAAVIVGSALGFLKAKEAANEK
jgi:cytochrome c-type biogenesis protein CcmF